MAIILFGIVAIGAIIGAVLFAGVAHLLTMSKEETWEPDGQPVLSAGIVGAIVGIFFEFLVAMAVMSAMSDGFSEAWVGGI